MPRPHRARKKAYYRVLDASALASLVRGLVRRAGSQVEAAKAKWLGCSQGYVSKLRQGKVEKLGSEMFARLERRLPNDEARRTLRRAVRTPLQAAHRHQYERWLWGRMGEAGAAPESVGKAVQQLRADPRYAACFTPLEKMVRARWGAASDDREARLVLAVEARAVWARLALAEYRVVAPLVQGYASAGVERTLAELHEAGELERYLRAMVRAECMLLDRPSADARVQEESPAQRRQRRQGERRGTR
jgi:hypothetical protein